MHYGWMPQILIIGISATFLHACIGEDEKKSLTLIHTGDFHGDFLPHTNPRDNQEEGGLARVFSVIEQIRKENEHSLYLHTGDTIQGSGETLFTRGQAMVDVLNTFGINAFVPGNWEFTFGVDRFLELFVGIENADPVAPWGMLAANAYYNGEPLANGATPPAGLLVATPFRVITLDGIKIGLFGCTTNRGPQIVGTNVTKGISFSNCKGQISTGNNSPIKLPDGTTTDRVEDEIAKYVALLRDSEKVDLVALLSEAGLAENILNAESYDGIDFIFSSDMHEETNYPVVVTTPNGGTTVIVEEGEDGAQVGEITLEFEKNKLKTWAWHEHDITAGITENPDTATLINKTLAPFRRAGFTPGTFENPFTATKLLVPFDEVVGLTGVDLGRNRYAHEWDEANAIMPALVEGNAHDLLTDAFRAATGADVGAIRGFRYVNNWAADTELTYGDLYHLLAVGAQVAVAEISAAQLNNQAESAADSVMNSDVSKWAGGWMFNFSGITFDLNPYDSQVLVGGTNPPTQTINQGRVFNFRLGRTALSDPAPGTLIVDEDRAKTITYASYFYDADSDMVNRIKITNPASIRKVMRDKSTGEFTLVAVNPPPANIADYEPVEAVEVVVRYIVKTLNGEISSSNLPFPRIHLTEKLPDTRPTLGFPVIEPVYGMNRDRYYPAIPAQYTPEQYDEN